MASYKMAVMPVEELLTLYFNHPRCFSKASTYSAWRALPSLSTPPRYTTVMVPPKMLP